MQCQAGNDGCFEWKTVKTCQAFCNASEQKCTDDMPTCDIRPGMAGVVQSVTDGDTLWVTAVND